jgi:hypothetical protein
VWCWGAGRFGQLGTGRPGSGDPAPALMQCR